MHQAATLLKNEAQLDGDGVRVLFQGLLGAMTQWKAQVGDLAGGIEHFLKVTRSYWRLFVPLLRHSGLTQNE